VIARIQREVSAYRAAVVQFTSAARWLLVLFGVLGFAYGAFSTLFTLYLVAVGFGERFIGLLVATGTLTGALASIPAGICFDRFGGRVVLQAGLALAAIGLAIECLVVYGPLLLVGGAIAATGVASAMVAQAPLLAAVSQEEERTYLYGVAAALGVVTSVAGTLYAGNAPDLLGLWLATDAERYRVTLLSGCAPALLSFWVVRKLQLPHRVEREGRAFLRVSLGHPAVRRLIVTGLLLASGGGLVVPFINIFFVETFAVGSREVSLVRTASTAATVAGALAAPLLAARAGLVLGVVLGRAVSAPWLFATGFAPSWWLAGGAYALRTFCVYCSDPLHTDFSMRVVPAELRATSNSLTFLTWNIALAATGWLGGQVAERFGYGLLFTLGTALTIVAAGCFWAAFRTHPLAGGAPVTVEWPADRGSRSH
jgi:MFS family permease